MSNADRKYRMGLKADFEGVMDFTCPAGTIINNDFVVPYTKYLSGVHIILQNHSFRDRVWLQIVATAGGNDIVIDQFGEGWYVDPSKSGQDMLIPDNVQSELNPNELPAGITNLRIRVKYQSTGAVPVDVLINMIFDVVA